MPSLFKYIAIPLIIGSVTIMFHNGIFINNKFQISEMAFLLIFIPVSFLCLSRKKRIHLPVFIKPLTLYVIAAFLSIFVSVSMKTTVVEFIGVLYLILFFLLWINLVETKELLIYAAWCWIGVSIIVSVIGLVSIVMAYGFNIDTIFCPQFIKHPYVNNIYRVRSTFFQNEKFFASFLLISIPLALSIAFKDKRRNIKLLLFGAVALFLINYFFTFSKGVIGTLVAIYIVTFGHNIISIQKYRWLLNPIKGLSITFILIAWLLVTLVTQIEILDHSSKTNTLFDLPDKMEAPFHYRPDIGIEQTDIKISYNYSYYYLLKKHALQMVSDHPFTGVGNGAFIKQMSIYEREGKIPEKYLRFDPHSMFFGKVAELGILGFLSLMYLWFAMIFSLRIKLKESENNDLHHLTLAFYAATVGFFIQGTDLDIMNFRFLWLLFGFNAIALRLQKE